MAQSQSSLAGDRTLNGSNHPGSAAYVDAATCEDESFIISGAEMATNIMKVKIASPFFADDRVNLIPALTMLLITALMLDPNSRIKSNDPTCSPIDKVADTAKTTNIDKYSVDLQTNAIKKQFVYFVTLETTISFQNLKLAKKMYAWLKENKIFITQHTMKTNHTTPIGYLLGMHPTLSSRDAMKLLLDGYIPNDNEYNLIMISTFYITEKGKKVNTHVVEVHVNSKEAKRAKELLSECWHQETFVKELEECSVGMLIDFIPNIQKGVMEVSTFCKTLRRQTEFAGNTIPISIEGIGGLEVEINHNGSLASLADIVKKLKSDKAKLLISGIEPTKFTSDSGHYLFLTQKNVVSEAEQKLDNLFETLAKNGQLDTFSIEGMFIRRINQIQSKQVATHADSLCSKYAPPVATVQAPALPLTPTCNTWKCTATFKLSHENFPEMNDTPTHCHKDKKARTETGTNDNADDTSLSPPFPKVQPKQS
jgi:hypothetical protein